MEIAKKLLKERYICNLKEEPRLFIGIELEYPIVHIEGLATDCEVSRQLMRELMHILEFKAVNYDDEGNPISISNSIGDCILFEVSYNTLEFAFAKATTIQEIELRLAEYLSVIQSFLRQYKHELQAKGINPCWKKNDNRPVKTSRYQMLSHFLHSSEEYPASHSFPDYGAFICGNQAQFDVSRTRFLRVLNVFNKIEPVKAYLFANSELTEVLPNYRISRDFFWEKSMHGYFNKNIGVYQEEFTTENDFLDYMLGTAMFSVMRDGEYCYFNPNTVEEYFSTELVTGYTANETHDIVCIVPQKEDIQYHRSYHYQELTTRGTIEFRSICTQPWERTFTPIAFHLGLLVNLEYFESIVATSNLYTRFGNDYDVLRKQFSKKELTQEEAELIKELSKELLECAYQGLKMRGYGEESYLYEILVD